MTIINPGDMSKVKPLDNTRFYCNRCECEFECDESETILVIDSMYTYEVNFSLDGPGLRLAKCPTCGAYKVKASY